MAPTSVRVRNRKASGSERPHSHTSSSHTHATPITSSHIHLTLTHTHIESLTHTHNHHPHTSTAMPQSLVTPTVTPTKSASSSSSSAQEAKEHTPEKLAVESLSTQLTVTNLNGKLDDARQSCMHSTAHRAGGKREGQTDTPWRAKTIFAYRRHGASSEGRDAHPDCAVNEASIGRA